MKKWMLVLVALFVSVSAFSQTCLNDVWQCLRSKQVPKAKKFMESCMASNPDNAAVWLMQANVNVQLYNYDLERMEKDPSVTPRYPNALEDAYAAFVKAVELDKNVTPMTGMLGAKEGQQLLAGPFEEKAKAAEKKGKTDDALKYYGLAARCYELAQKKANAAVIYFDIAVVYSNMNDKENCVKMLEKSIATMPNLTPAAYVELYYNYEAQKDTVKCGEILAKAQKNFAEDEAKMAQLYSPMMSYYATVGDNEKLLAICDKAVATGNLDMIADCATYLTNAKSYAKAEQVLTDALANNPKAIWHKEYLAGLMLLDLKNPAKVLAISSQPVIKAREKYELDGFRGSVIFPGGMLLEPNGEVKVYYGAADTVECLATATVDDLLRSLDITF